MSEPKVPPFEMVKVPPAMSSMAIWSLRALSARSPSVRSMPAKLRPSALRITGTTRPRGELTATEMST
jgi:hypothetical protein